MNKHLTRDQILAVNDLKPFVEAVDVPEWGGTVYVRVMTGGERDAFEGKFTRDKHNNLRAFLAVCTVCDANGVSLFKSEDVAALGEKSSAALDRVFDVALRLNRLRASDVAELEKN